MPADKRQDILRRTENWQKLSPEQKEKIRKLVVLYLLKQQADRKTKQ